LIKSHYKLPTNDLQVDTLTMLKQDKYSKYRADVQGGWWLLIMFCNKLNS